MSSRCRRDAKNQRLKPEPAAGLLGRGMQLLDASFHCKNALWFNDPFQGEKSIGAEPLALARG